MLIAKRWFTRTACIAFALYVLPFAAKALKTDHTTLQNMMTVHPPAMDYSNVCVSERYLTAQTINALIKKEASGATLSTLDMYRLGRIYDSGMGVLSENHPKAYRYFSTIAKRSFKYQPEAQIYLGNLLLNGNNVTRDTQAARALLKKATPKKPYLGGYVLGIHYQSTGDYAQAESFYKLAAAEGQINSIFALIELYKKGLVAAPDIRAIEELFLHAQNQLLAEISSGECDALYEFGKIYMFETVLDRNEVLAAEWFAAAVKAGNIAAMNQLARLYRKGIGVEYNQQEAIRLWELAASKGSLSAKHELGMVYAFGEGRKQDISKAISYLSETANRDYMPSLTALIDIYSGNYDASAADPVQKLQWLRRAVNTPGGAAELHMQLADSLLYTTPDQQNVTEAFKHYTIATEMGHAEAAHQLAVGYRFGWGVEQHPIKALKFSRLAAGKNRHKSALYMAELYACGIKDNADDQKIKKWLDRALSQGNIEAYFTYDRFFPELPAQTRDAMSASYLKQGVDAGHSKAIAYAALNAYQAGETERAEKLMQRAIADSTPADAYLVFGRAYLQGNPFAINVQKGLEYLQTSYELGNTSALYETMAHKLDEASLNSSDLDMLTRAAIEEKHADSLMLLGEIYAHPFYYNNTLSQHYYKLAAYSGENQAVLTLANTNARADQKNDWISRATNAKICTPQEKILAADYFVHHGNVQQGLTLLQNAARQSTKALRLLADMYLRADYVARDAQKAREYLQEASARGDSEADIRLQLLNRSNL